MNLKVGTGSGLESQLWNYLNPGDSFSYGFKNTD